MKTIVLDATNKSITAVLSGAPATTNPDFTAAYADSTATTFTQGANDGVLNGVTPVTLIASPAASTQRTIKDISIQNRDTAVVTLTLNYVTGANTRQIWKGTLNVGDTYTISGVYDSSGRLKESVTGSIPMTSAANDFQVGDGTGAWVKQTLAQTKTILSVPESNATPTFPSQYERDTRFIGSVTTITTPNTMWVNINGLLRIISTQATLPLGTAGSWDTTAGTDYTTAANRAGKDFYIYACENSVVAPKLLLSASATYPSGYNTTTSRKIGGFHCLCVAAGTISGHTLTGYAAGSILPQSVWDLKWQPKNLTPAGMVYSSAANIWADIYLMSGTGSSTLSVNGGTISDTRTWMDFVDDCGAVGKRLLRDREFQLIAAGCNEGTNITGSADPTTTGGHSDTAGRRMLSNIGCEDCAGVMWQWLDEQSYQYVSGNTSGTFGWVNQTGGKGQLYIQGATADVKLVAGGSWDSGAYCGSRCRDAIVSRWYAASSVGCRSVSEPI